MERGAAFATLNVSCDATPGEIRSAYRRRAFETHPDRVGGSSAAFQAVAEAYRVLSGGAAPDEPGGTAADGGDRSRVPGADAAKTLFEYLSDLASDMILNGATPDAVVTFLAGEGCPAAVARALEQDLRARVAQAGAPCSPPPPEAARASEPRAADARRGTAGAAPSPGSPWWWAAGAALAASALLFWSGAALRRTSAEVASASEPAAPRAEPSAPAAAPPRRGTPARPRAHDASPPRRIARAERTGTLASASAELDGERADLERDQRRFAAEVSALEAERRGIEAARGAPEVDSDPLQRARLRRRETLYDERLAEARRVEGELARRVSALNAKIVAYNERVRAAR